MEREEGEGKKLGRRETTGGRGAGGGAEAGAVRGFGVSVVDDDDEASVTTATGADEVSAKGAAALTIAESFFCVACSADTDSSVLTEVRASADEDCISVVTTGSGLMDGG